MSYFNLQEKVQELKTALNESSDFAYRYYKKEDSEIVFVYLKSIIDQQLFSSAVYYPLQTFEENLTIDKIKNRVLKCSDIKEAKEDEIIEMLDAGFTKTYICKFYGVSTATLYSFMKRTKIYIPQKNF